jgi:hypothetical protein
MGWVVKVTLRPFYPRERPGTQCIGAGWAPGAGLDGCGNSCHPAGFDPQTVQAVSSRYTDWAIPAQFLYSEILFIYNPFRILPLYDVYCVPCTVTKIFWSDIRIYLYISRYISWCHTWRVNLNNISIRRQQLLSKYFLLYRLPSTLPFDSVKILDATSIVKYYASQWNTKLIFS